MSSLNNRRKKKGDRYRTRLRDGLLLKGPGMAFLGKGRTKGGAEKGTCGVWADDLRFCAGGIFSGKFGMVRWQTWDP